MLKVSSTSPLMRRPQALQPCIHHTANTDCLACHLILPVRRTSFTRLTSALEGSILVYGEGNKFEDAQADHDRRWLKKKPSTRRNKRFHPPQSFITTPTNQLYSRQMPVIILMAVPFCNPATRINYNQLPSCPQA